MTVECAVRLVAGIVVIVSVLLSVTLSPYWLIVTGFVGLNLTQSAFTKFCPAEIVLKRLFYQ